MYGGGHEFHNVHLVWGGEEGVQQVPTIIRYVLEELVICRGADTGKRWRRGGAVSEPGRLPEEGLQARPVVCTGEPPPGRRGVAQLRDNDGLVDYVQCGGWQIVLFSRGIRRAGLLLYV